MPWFDVPAAGELETEDVLEVEVQGTLLALYRNGAGDYYATDAICTHARAHLAEGLVIGNVIECPKHQGRFDLRTGEPKGPPASVALGAYPVRVADGRVQVELG